MKIEVKENGLVLKLKKDSEPIQTIDTRTEREKLNETNLHVQNLIKLNKININHKTEKSEIEKNKLKMNNLLKKIKDCNLSLGVPEDFVNRHFETRSSFTDTEKLLREEVSSLRTEQQKRIKIFSLFKDKISEIEKNKE